jgi:phytol kinase
LHKQLRRTLGWYALACAVALVAALTLRKVDARLFVLCAALFTYALIALQPVAVLYVSLKYRLRLETRRKLVHTAIELTLAGFSLLGSMWGALFLSALVCAGAVAMNRRNSYGGMFDRPGEKAALATYSAPLGFAAANLVAAGEAAIVFPAMLVISLADSAAALVGTAYGRHAFSIFGSKKSIEGSLAFWVVAMAVLALSVPEGARNSAGMLAVAGIAAALAVAEALAGRGSDNFVVPVLGALLIGRFLLVQA